MKIKARFFTYLTGLLLATAPNLSAQEEQQLSSEDQAAMEAHADFLDSISWTMEGTGTLGSRADLAIPSGYRFTGSPGASKMMEYYGNLTDGSELGYLAPMNMDWFAVFEFSDIGYVKDDDKDKLDADAILKDLQDGQVEANKQLTERGMPTLQVLGWHTPPFYNPSTNNLEWAIRLSSGDEAEFINYKTKLLGRRGVMDVVLVCDADQLGTVIPEFQRILTGFAYKEDESYAAYEKGDNIAKYGLIGLIGGGGLLVAAKSGLLAKLWKPIAIGIVAVGAFIKKIFFGNTKKDI